MNAQDLKNSILQLAVQGKLVEQRAEEGTARELLEQIKLEKDQLIKDKKIKKSKPLPEIAEDEIPFEIPESWEWVRLGDVVEMIMGQSPKGTDVVEGGDGIEFHQGKVYFGVDYLKSSNHTTINPTKIVEADTTLLCVRAPVGTANITKRRICIGRGLCGLVGYGKIKSSFLLNWVRAFKNDFIKKATGTTFIAITGDVVREQIIPLPPLEEQHRIVAKIEEILPYIDKYDKAYKKLEAFNKKFPEDMKKSILQMAMQGKLVEQRPEEGTADELYEQIQDAKKKFGIKKNKKILNISEEDYLYDIPKTWKWVRIGEIFQTSSGTTPLKSNQDYYNSQDYSWVRTTDLNNGILTHGEVKISQKAKDECNLDIIPYNSVCLAMYGGAGTIGKNALIQFETTINQSVCAIHPNGFLDMKYLLYYTQFFRPLWMNYASGSRKDPNINQVIINNAVIPLPPLEEQYRIVTKIEELLPYCDQLIK